MLVVITGYKYDIKERAGHKCIVIEDLSKEGKCVAANLESIAAEIAEKEAIDPTECLIVYRDSHGNWDGWNAELGAFVALYMRGWQAAVDQFRRRSMVLV